MRNLKISNYLTWMAGADIVSASRDALMRLSNLAKAILIVMKSEEVVNCDN